MEAPSNRSSRSGIEQAQSLIYLARARPHDGAQVFSGVREPVAGILPCRHQSAPSFASAARAAAPESCSAPAGSSAARASQSSQTHMPMV